MQALSSREPLSKQAASTSDDYHQRRYRFFVVFTLVLALKSIFSLDADGDEARMPRGRDSWLKVHASFFHLKPPRVDV